MSEYLLLHTRLGYSDSNSIIIAANVTNRRAKQDMTQTILHLRLQFLVTGFKNDTYTGTS